MSHAVSTSIGAGGEKYSVGKFGKKRQYEKRSRKKSWQLLFRGMGVPRLRMDKGSLWTGVVLLTLTCGVPSLAQERLPALIDSEPLDPSLYTIFRDLYEQQLLRQIVAQQGQPPEPEPQKRAFYQHVPLPLALHVGDSSREENKRASNYMALCHFKICSVGRKRSNVRSLGLFRK